MKTTQVWPDPLIERGPYKVLPRTDGKFAVVDTRAPFGADAAAVVGSKEDATVVAERLVANGSPESWKKDDTDVRASAIVPIVIPTATVDDGGDTKGTTRRKRGGR